MYEMVTGVRPVYTDKKTLSFPEDIPLTEECKNLIEGLLKKDPKKRFDADQLADHPFVK